MSWVIVKATGERVYAAVLEGKRVGWGTRKAAEQRRQELELYYMWAFDAVVEEVEDEADRDEAGDAPDASGQPEAGSEERGPQGPVGRPRRVQV